MTWFAFPKERPIDDQTVIGCQKGRDLTPIICWYSEEDNCFYDIYSLTSIKIVVDYWMPVPKLPEEK